MLATLTCVSNNSLLLYREFALPNCYFQRILFSAFALQFLIQTFMTEMTCAMVDLIASSPSFRMLGH